MIKVIVIFTVIFSLTACENNEDEKDGISLDEVNGYYLSKIELYNDEIISYVTEVTYDQQKHSFIYSKDNGNDGVINRISFSFLTKEGQRSRLEIDSDVDGVIDSIVDYEYSDDYLLVKESFDLNNDEIYERFRSALYENRHILKRDYDEDGDGEVDSIDVFDYTNEGEIKIETDHYIDGSVNARSVYYYDSNNIFYKAEHYSIQGEVVSLGQYETFEYDANGNMIEENYFDGDDVQWGRKSLTYTRIQHNVYNGGLRSFLWSLL